MKRGAVDDFTDGPIDLLAAFVVPGRVLALGCEDTANAKSRAFEVIKVPQAPAEYNEATGTWLGLSQFNVAGGNIHCIAQQKLVAGVG